MAYPDGQEILSQLPLGGKGVTSDEAEDRIRRWKAKLEFAPTSDREKALAEEIVSSGAAANMERIQLRRAGHRETPNADEAIKEANDLLASYNAMRVTEGREVPVPDGYAGYMQW